MRQEPYEEGNRERGDGFCDWKDGQGAREDLQRQIDALGISIPLEGKMPSDIFVQADLLLNDLGYEIVIYDTQADDYSWSIERF